MIAGIVPATGGPVVRVLLVTTVTLVASAAIFATVRLAHDRPRVIAAVASLIVLVGGIRLWQADQAWKGSYETAAAVSAIRDLDNGPTPQDVIGVSIMPDEYGPLAPPIQQMAYALAYQWHLPEYRFVLDNGPKDDIGPYVFAVTNDALLMRDGGTILWEDPDRWMALWLEPEG